MGSLRKTSFGSLEVLYKHKGKVIAELAYFKSCGKGHTHDEWEVCYVLSGNGYIFIKGHNIHKVKEGDVIHVPPYAIHWMEVDKDKEMKILLVYTANTIL